MTKIEIWEWLKEQNYQTAYEETGEYEMYYSIDMPKILNDFLILVTNKFILKNVSQDKESLLQRSVNRVVPYLEEIQRLKEIIKTQENYINKTLIKDSNLIKKLKDALVMITKRDDWTSGECRHHAKEVLKEISK